MPHLGEFTCSFLFCMFITNAEVLCLQKKIFRLQDDNAESVVVTEMYPERFKNCDTVSERIGLLR
jgi:hypothetical protein